MPKSGQFSAESMLQQNKLESLDTKLSSCNLSFVQTLKLLLSGANTDFPINALFDANPNEWTLRDLQYFYTLNQGNAKPKFAQRRLTKSELPFVLKKALLLGAESGTAIFDFQKTLKKIYKHCICEGFYFKNQCIGFFICFVQKDSLYIPIVWLNPQYRFALAVCVLQTLLPLCRNRSLSACLWNRTELDDYVVSIQDEIATLDVDKILHEFGELQWD